MDEFRSFINLNIDELSRNINLERLVPELIRNNFLFGQDLQIYNKIVSKIFLSNHRYINNIAEKTSLEVEILF
jgi:hypothetical protein